MKSKFYLIVAFLIPLFVSCDKSLDLSAPDEDGFVDLGLSVKWAKCNYGASSPENAGKYYMIITNGSSYSVNDADKAGIVLPTLEEAIEFQTNCKISYTSHNGVNGFLAVGPNGNSIFIPAVGRGGSSQGGVPDHSNENFTYLWTGTISTAVHPEAKTGTNYFLSFDATKTPVTCIMGLGVGYALQCREVRR